MSPRSPATRLIRRLVLCVILLSTVLPTFLLAQTPANVIVWAGRWIVGTLVGYKVGNLLDRLAGEDYNSQLAAMESRLQIQIGALRQSQSNTDRTQEALLREQLSIIQSQRNTISELLAGAVTRPELERLQRRTDDQLSRLATILQQDARRLQFTEGRVAVHDTQIAGLQGQIVALRDSLNLSKEMREAARVLEKARRNPPLRIGPFGSLGGGYGSISTRLKDNGVDRREEIGRFVGLARAGWRANRHFAVAIEGTAWLANSSDTVLGGQSVQLSDTLTSRSIQVTLPLFFSLGPSVPLTVFAGPALVLESQDLGFVDATGGITSRYRISGSGLGYVVGASVDFQASPTMSVTFFSRFSTTRADLHRTGVADPVITDQRRRTLFLGAAVSFHNATYTYQ